MVSTTKRIIWFVVDECGAWDDGWDFIVRTFSDEDRRAYEVEWLSDSGEYDDYWSTTVEHIALIDGGEK